MIIAKGDSSAQYHHVSTPFHEISECVPAGSRVTSYFPCQIGDKLGCERMVERYPAATILLSHSSLIEKFLAAIRHHLSCLGAGGVAHTRTRAIPITRKATPAGAATFQ